MIEAVAGFLFSLDHQRVALIRKNRPSFHAGMLNGIGGKINYGENPYQAMLREFTEEAGVVIGSWNKFLTLQVPDWRVHFFRAESNLIDDVKTLTDEDVSVYYVAHVIGRKYSVVSELCWTLPMALCPGVIDAVVTKGCNG